MIIEAHLGKEIIVTIVNKVGLLAEISEIIANHGINIEAVGGYATGNNASIMIVTRDNLRAIEALKAKGYKGAVEEEAVMIDMENKPGALKNITRKLAQNDIDIKHIYGSGCSGDCPAHLIISCSNNEKALIVLKK
ncbi:MAG: ACT domain-containing protein [Candidatus Omnitrophica bacterium]|nr:ACT domain-containing protein [Candidatus Omnitrophota bacterium]MDD5236705.1 ACT domain-containing protein [Candidatus Omnitrophota bacterium]MDD5610918.1 ACT domain-containing protein [Candidatus Omnitrophota bacterium]